MYQVEVVRTFAITKIRWLLPLILLSLFAWIQIAPVVVSAYAGLGGYISEKMLSGAAIDSLYLNRTTAGPLVIASGPAISTGAATAIAWPATGTTATLHGTISSLNGMPTASYYFQWGYAPGALTNTTPTTVGAVGDNTATILHFDPGAVNVYYRFVALTDSTSYGAVASFSGGATKGEPGGGPGAGYFLLWNIFTLCIALGMIASIFLLVRDPVAMVVLSILGMVAVMFARAVLGLSIW